MSNDGRYLGLDVGTKRIGVAVSDPLFITAQPVKTVSRVPEKRALAEIKEICDKYSVSLIVAGLPKNMDGTLGYQANDVQEFTSKLSEFLNINVIFEDERLSSKSAERFLIEQNRKPSKNKGLVDMASAVIILQQYLARR